MTLMEDVLARLLPWLGGMAGLTLVYFAGVWWLQYRQDRRLQRIERDLHIQHGLLLGLLRGGRRR